VRFSSSKYTTNAAGASPRTPLGKLTELPQTPRWFSGSRFAAGEGGQKGGEGGKGGKAKGINIPPLLFFTF